MIRWTSILIFVAFAATACDTLMAPRSEPVAELEPVSGPAYTAPPANPGLALAPDQRFMDVPLPLNVKEDPDRTFVFENASFRIGKMVYTSKASVNDLAQFYITECPAADWKRESVIQAEGVEMLYIKPDSRLKITIRDLGITRGRELVLLLTPDEGQ